MPDALAIDAFSDKAPVRGPAWLATYKRRRADAIPACSEIKRRATENHKFATPGEEQTPLPSGDQHSATGFGGRGKKKFALMSVNEVHPVLSTMAGRQVMGRFERRYIPRRKDIRRWAEVLSDWDRAVADASHADQEESSAFRNGPGTAGLSWIEVSVDYLEDPDGMIVIEERPIWNMLWPAQEARKKNLVDREWDIRGDWYPIDEFKALWPTKVSAVRNRIGQAPQWDPSGDGKPTLIRTPWDRMKYGDAPDTELPFADPHERRVWVENYQWREISARFHVAVPPEGLSYAETDAQVQEQQGLQAAQQAGQSTQPQPTPYDIQEMSPQEFREFSSAHTLAHPEEPEIPPHRYLRKQQVVYRYADICGNVVLEEGEIEIGRFRREAMTGYPFTQPRKVDWRSVVDALRMPQIWTNIFLTMLVKYMQINPKGLLFAEKGVFRSRNEALGQFASTGGYVEVERGKISGSPNPPFTFHSGGPTPMGGLVQHMLGFAQDMIPRSVGFNWAALGQLGPDLRRISGTVVEHVRDAMVASQAELYDSLALCRKRIGLILIATLGKVLGLDHLRRVVGEDAFMEEVQQMQPDPATGEMSMRPVIDPQTGQPQMRPVEPPEDLLDEAIWSVSVEETRPAPDRMRFVWESLVESGGLDALTNLGAIDAEGAVEIMPDLPEENRKRWLDRIRMRRQMAAAQPQQPPLAA